MPKRRCVQNMMNDDCSGSMCQSTTAAQPTVTELAPTSILPGTLHPVWHHHTTSQCYGCDSTSTVASSAAGATRTSACRPGVGPALQAAILPPNP